MNPAPENPPSPLWQSRRRRARAALLITSAVTAALLLFSTSLPHARGPQDDDEVVRVDAELVVLNVTVTDREGRYVRKLARADFRLAEDGREQRITTFGEEETPFAAALLLDTSGSMEGRLSLARSAAIRFLEGMREEDVAAVYRFDSQVEQLQDFTAGRDLPPVAYGLGAKGMTALNDAVLAAARDISRRPEKRRAIVLLSDGFDTKSGATADKALAAAIAAGATLYTVDMSDPQSSPRSRLMAANVLRNFAQKSGGRYMATPGGRALADAFAGIVEELRHQYTVGYRPDNRARDGRWREIEVNVVSRPDVKARTRRGYRAPKA